MRSPAVVNSSQTRLGSVPKAETPMKGKAERSRRVSRRRSWINAAAYAIYRSVPHAEEAEDRDSRGGVGGCRARPSAAMAVEIRGAGT